MAVGDGMAVNAAGGDWHRAGDEPRPKLLVLLLGGRPSGLFFLAAQLQPQQIALIASRDSQKDVPEVEDTLRRMLPRVRFVDLGEQRLVHPYRSIETRRAIEHALAAAPDLAPCISATGAPLPMSIAGYEAAKQAACPLYYINTNNSEAIDLTDPEATAPLAIKVSVATYLAFYDLLPDFRHRPPAHDAGGQWLEQYVWQAAQTLRHEGKPLFDECRQGFRFKRVEAGREIDFIGVRHGMALIASCKTGKDARNKAHLDELETIAERLGGRYCVRLYITDQTQPALAPDGSDPWAQFLTQARAARIVVVTGGDLARLGEILQREMLTPTYPRR